MKLESIPSPRQSIFHSLQQVRNHTLKLLETTSDFCFFTQADPDFSPIGWHFGHIAFTEAYWILEYLGGKASSLLADSRLFSADGLPKQERQNLPAIAVIQNYLETTRQETLKYLAIAPVTTQERLWWWLIQHECQHTETIAFLRQLHQRRDRSVAIWNFSPSTLPDINTPMVKIAAGEFIMGSNQIAAQDNERPAHRVFVDTYWLDRDLVTCGQYAQFIAAGGYQQPKYWSEAGWQWLKEHSVACPLYWSDTPDWQEEPVCGVNYYEAEAYANFVGKRLPTEAEWEKAALSCISQNYIPQSDRSDVTEYDLPRMLGHVWQWTQDWFTGYSGFVSYPYSGYSQAYFDRQHKVLKGGSWATSPPALRTSFRNWYHPHVRQILAGFRCAK